MQLPDYPEHSSVLAVEICNAEQGVYEVEVNELHRGRYRLSVSARGDADTETLVLHHVSQSSRMRRYRFAFKIENRKVVVRWLDKGGQEQMKIEDGEW